MVETDFNFDGLVSLCWQTHQEMQARAANSVNLSLVARNWLIGWYIVEYEQQGSDRAKYGKATLKSLSKELKNRIGRGFSVDSLEQMRRFFIAYRDAIRLSGNSETLSRNLSVMSLAQADRDSFVGKFALSWSHYIVLLTLDHPAERQFYEIESVSGSWSVRELERQVASSLYERLALSQDRQKIQRLSQQGQVIEKPTDLIKDPYVLEFLDLKEQPSYSEQELESAIIDKLESFLLELGKGFLFEARQKRFTFDNDHFYVDLVFYNRLLRCYVLIDLKRDKLTHQDLGQMQMYVNYFDRHVKTEDELPTIGMILCHRKNDALVELTLPANANIFASKYQLYLPSKEELKAELVKIETELLNEQV